MVATASPTVRLVNPEHPENADFSISVREAGRITLVNWDKFSKAPSEIEIVSSAISKLVFTAIFPLYLYKTLLI